jgi:hypothetical protein
LWSVFLWIDQMGIVGLFLFGFVDTVRDFG